MRVNVVFHVLEHDDIPKWWYSWWFHGRLVELYGMIRQIEFGGVFDGGDLWCVCHCGRGCLEGRGGC